MKKTVEAIRYGIETLKVSPDEMFSLIKAANTDDDFSDRYGLWLAREIIKIAEKDGVGYSQLLVKKFAITQEILEGKEATIRESWVKKIKSKLAGEVFTVNFEEVDGTSLDDIVWENGTDYDSENAFFTDSLPESFAKCIRSNNRVTLVAKLGSDSCHKGSDVALDAKARSLSVKTKGGALLYRLCLLSEVFGLDENFRFAFLVNTDFLSDKANVDSVKQFLLYFKYKGIVIKSSDLFEDYAVDGSFAFVLCQPRGMEDKALDSFMFKDSEGIVKRYSSSKLQFLDYLKSTAGIINSSINLDFGKSWDLRVSPEGSLPIHAGNFEDCIVYYAVVSSLVSFGFSREIPVVVSGNSQYKNLLGNCVPLFLFDSKNDMCWYSDEWQCVLSDAFTCLYKDSKIYFSYEAKELISVVKAIIERAKKEGMLLKERSLNDIRKEIGDSALDEAYCAALVGLKGYIKTLYREMV